MERLKSKTELAEMCQHVFDQAGLSKMEVSEVMGVSDVAVHYMVNDPEKGMADLRKRFLRRFANLHVEGQGYLVEGTGTVTKKEAVEAFDDLTETELEALMEDEAVETTEDGRIIHASLYAHMHNWRLSKAEETNEDA